MLYSPYAGGKKKHNQTISITENEMREVVVCPNCLFHFKPQSHTQNTRISTQIIHNYKSIQNKEKKKKDVPQRNSPLARVQMVQSQVSPELQRAFIDSLRNKGISKLEKLKNLNNLNQLKKSRSSQNENFQLLSFKEEHSSISDSSSIDKQRSASPPRSSKRVNLKSSSLINIEIQQKKQQSLKLKSKNISFEQKQRWIQELQLSEERRVLLQKVFEWISNSGIRQKLPSYLKVLLAEYFDDLIF